MPTEDDSNPYEVVGVSIAATEAEIRKAYRQRSLKLHPDRNPDLPDAAQKFHELNQAYELLLDPLRRLAIDTKVRAHEAKKTRFAAFDTKRKGLQEELEERERQFKKRKVDKEAVEKERERENQRIMEEGKKLREERERIAHEKGTKLESAMDETPAPELGPLDTTIKLKFSASAHPDLTTVDAITSLMARFGETDSSATLISIKPSKKASKKGTNLATVVIPFKRIGDAVDAVRAGGNTSYGLNEIDISWAGGSEPEIVGWLRVRGKLEPVINIGDGSTSSAGVTAPSAKAPPFDGRDLSSGLEAFGLDYESLILKRMRDAERKKLEKQIREQEGDS